MTLVFELSMSKETNNKEQRNKSEPDTYTMAPIYTSNNLKNNAVQAPEYIQRNLDKLNTGRLETLHIVGIPHVIQPHYPQYIANLPAFLTATAIKRKVTCGRSYFFQIDPKSLIPLPLPPLTIAPAKPFGKEEDKTAFLQKLPGEVTTTVYLKREAFVLSSLTPTQVIGLPAVDPNVPSSSDSVSLNGMRQYLTTMKILTAFLATHTYPAFQSAEVDHDLYSHDLDIHYPDGMYKPKLGFRGDSAYYKEKGSKKWFSEEVVRPQDYEQYPTDGTSSLLGGVFVAKPAPLYPSVNYGPPSSIPSLPGFLFPYFHGMIYPAEDVTVSIMRRFFLACFGENSEDTESRWNTWVKGVTKWHRTKAGLCLSHIFFCLQTALEAQGRLYVVISNGNYLGCAILGFKFDISFNGMRVEADGAVDLAKLAGNLDEHSKALKTLENTLKGLTLVGEDDINMDVELDMSNARAVHREILKRVVPPADEIEVLTKLVKQLTFTQKYWPISGETLARAISMIISDDEVPADWPMYLDPLSIHDGSRIFEVLSVFGPMAPSLVDAGGSDVKIPQGTKDDDPESCVPEGGVSIKRPKLFISGKKLHVACNDMRSVWNKRKIRQNVNERAGGFRTISVSGKQRDAVWNALKMIPWETPNEKGKKRAAEDEGGTDKKKQKKDEVTEETLGLF